MADGSINLFRVGGAATLAGHSQVFRNQCTWNLTIKPITIVLTAGGVLVTIKLISLI